MDYEEKYNEALQRAKSIYRDAKSEHCTHTDWLENIFLELKESEDESIRRTLIHIVKGACGKYGIKYQGKDISEEKLLAWLEKQGSQNLANSVETCKVEPKFKIGDWVIDKQDIVHQIANVVENVTNHTYGYDIVGGGYFNDNTEGVRLWTIKDAKDGDVLCSGQIILLFKKWESNDWNFAIAYAGIDISGKLQITDKHWLISNHAHPATKEQHDLLFQKMKEAGYEWDAEKKELKKVEQKPAWGEEDETGFRDAMWAIEQARTIAKDENDMGNLWYAEKWLKSLKDRVRPQPKSDWNNNDEISFNRLMAICADERVRRNSVFSEKEIKDLMDWLESIKKRAQPQWKPSDEQMTTLDTGS